MPIGVKLGTEAPILQRFVGSNPTPRTFNTPLKEEFCVDNQAKRFAEAAGKLKGEKQEPLQC